MLGFVNLHLVQNRTAASVFRRQLFEMTFEVRLDSFRFLGKCKGFRERIDRIKETFRGPQYPIGG